MAIATRILVLCLVLFVGSASSHALYGDVDSGNEFPFVVRVTIKKGKGFRFCSASMRNKRMAITAAHCVYDEDGDRVLADISLRFTDEKGAVRRVAAKAFVPPDYAAAAKKLWPLKKQFDKARAKNDSAQLKELALPLLEAMFSHTSRDFALLLPESDVNVAAFLPATIMDDDLPFAGLLSGFETPRDRWTSESYALAGATYERSFAPRLPVAPRPDDKGRREERFVAHAVGFGRTCRTDKDTKCTIFDGKRRHSAILLGADWYYFGIMNRDIGFMLSLFSDDPEKREVMLPGDSGGPILIRDKVTGRFTQVGIITSTNHTKRGAFWTSAPCLLQHAGMWKEFLASAEYRNAMLDGNKPVKPRKRR